MLKMTFTWHMETSLSTELHNKCIQGVNNIMETLRNCEIEFVCVGYIDRASVGNTECSSSVSLHSVVFMSVHL
jgi:hypothetical protein